MDDYLAKPYTAADLFAVLEGGAPPASHASAPVAAGSESPVDIARLRTDLRAMGIEGSLEDLVTLFLSDGPGRMAAIRTAAGSGDAMQIATAAHVMKSSAGVLRANRLMNVVAAMETAAKGRDVPKATSLLGEALAAFDATQAWLASGAWRQ
jgi:HPt (histidine-containing phosphotransfer) domain-containing protein